tara:strand:+ start:27832 stop:28782 length:951 start_codon:yes stop_codon:yes gene_type:complete
MAFKDHSIYTIAFYNLENLFDTEDDPLTLDDDFTVNAPRQWNAKRFQKKIKKLGRVISQIGYNDIQHPPAIVGIAEVENETVVKALVDSKFLKDKGYQYVHFDSSDERGIDTALLYRSDYVTILEANTHTLYLENAPGVRDYTRDILHIRGTLQGQEVHILVNHWPSRRQGAEETAYKRIAAAQKNLEIVHNIAEDNPKAKCIIMGDFNDDPHSESLTTLSKNGFFNPMETLLTQQQGSSTHRGAWNLFDQILISYNFLQGHENTFRFDQAKIFNPKKLQEYKGKYKGSPFRTYAGTKYLGGMSDHFPVYALFSIK